MLELLTSYSLGQILIIVVLVVLAVKEAITIYDFFKNRIKTHVEGEEEEDRRLDDVLDTVTNLSERMDDVILKQNNLEDKVDLIADGQKLLKQDVASIKSKQEELDKRMDEQNEVLKLLTESDKDQLKSYIVKEYHYFCDQKGWVDDFSMDSLNKCFEHYEKEGGNSYVHDLMSELRQLPHHPPTKK